MSGVRRWRETSHLDRAMESASGREVFDSAIARLLDEARGWVGRNAGAARPHPETGRRSHGRVHGAGISIEAGDVSTQDVLTRYIAALGGTLKLIADFGDEQMKVA